MEFDLRYSQDTAREFCSFQKKAVINIACSVLMPGRKYFFLFVSWRITSFSIMLTASFHVFIAVSVCSAGFEKSLVLNRVLAAGYRISSNIRKKIEAAYSVAPFFHGNPSQRQPRPTCI
jgi:hypothetical protein